MPTKIQLRRITNAQRLALTVAPALGEPIYCTDTKQMWVGDGTALGGQPLTLDWANLTNIPGYVDDVLEFANLAAFPATGETGKIYVRTDTNQVYRWSGSAYIELSSAGVADTAVKLATARTITLSGAVAGAVAFDGSANVTLTTTSTTLAPKASPALTGTPTAPTAAVQNSSTQIATTAFVNAEIAADRPYEATIGNVKMDGTAALGTSTGVARGDHVHPTDTTRAPLASPTFTGVPAAPTAAAGNNTTQVATTAFVKEAVDAAVLVIDGGTA
jgi:hypothetical protein